MEKRLQRAAVTTAQDLCSLSRERMKSIWGGVLGERMWLELRGEDLPEPAAQPLQTISRQHILPPEQRTREGCRQVSLKMLHDCVRKLRRLNLWGGGVGPAIYHMHLEYAFQAHCRVPACQDGLTLQEHILPLLPVHQTTRPARSSCTSRMWTHRLFLICCLPNGARAALLPPQAMDAIQRRFGRDAVYPASLHGARKSAPTRISFGPPPPLEDSEQVEH